MPQAVPGKVKPLSVRQRRFLEIYFENGGNGTRACLQLAKEQGKEMDADAAGAVASKMLSVLRETDAFREKLHAAGLDDFAIIRKARDLMECKRPLVDYKSGEILGDFDDGPTQVKALEIAAGWLGRSPKQVIELQTELPLIVIERRQEDPAE